MTERRINEIFEVDGEYFKCVGLNTGSFSCEECALDKFEECNAHLQCCGEIRSDNSHAMAIRSTKEAYDKYKQGNKQK